ncbi:hypothetical protein SADUNF_Sadunf16G0145700 [Salix dunnii]|uniref:RRM domain-containing protein n=1 Tax=Salix dunnii TaxID=1413687 RepID=A0A835J6U8_9ROSI|nr:hypothetical protein SADUNF_Sadunf16G0145700 [Salix dunnii]
MHTSSRFGYRVSNGNSIHAHAQHYNVEVTRWSLRVTDGNWNLARELWGKQGHVNKANTARVLLDGNGVRLKILFCSVWSLQLCLTAELSSSVFVAYMFRKTFPDGPDGREMGAKRQRMVDQGPSFYGNSPGSSFMYNAPPYGYVSQPPPPFPVVRLRGLPFDCTETDVAEFFHGLDIVDVLFVHKGGKFTGEAFCVLGYPLQVDFALQKNRQNMGRRYVEVFRSKRQDYYKAIANEVSESRGSPRRNISRAKSYDEGKELAEHTGVLRLRGLPFSAGKDDIMEFFKDFVLSEDSIHITMNSEGRPTGEAFVEFANAEDSKAAMAKDRMTLGSRYIELFPSSIEELDEAVSRGR